MADESIFEALGRISASADGPPWLSAESHRLVREALENVADERARMVLTDLLGLAGVLERRMTNIHKATDAFLLHLDDRFRNFLDEQTTAMGAPANPLEKAMATLRVAEQLTLGAEKRASLDEIQNAVAAIGSTT